MRQRDFISKITMLAMVFALISEQAIAQKDQETNWRVERNNIEQLLLDDLNPVADWCKSVSRPDWAIQTLNWHRDRDPARLYIFIPSETSRVRPSDPVERKWFDQVKVALDRHAERVFELAERACNAEAGATSFQLLNEVLYYDPDHERVRDMLGHRKTETGWQVATDRLKLKPATRSHSTMNWKAGEYLLVSTPHFNIASQASEEMTRLLAVKLERWQSIWRQVFFEYWNRPRTVKRWFDGKSKFRTPPRKFDIVFFADRQQYIDQLRERVKGIEESTGYYNDAAKTSFFFASKELNTWRHELTHQLFQESIRTRESPFDNGYIWLGEGIAMYFESLTDFGDYVTLGGFEAERLQYARIRRIRESFYVPLDDLSQFSRKEFQLRDDLARMYSQSAGITHMLMDADSGSTQTQLVQFLKLMYTVRLKRDTFEKTMGTGLQELDESYSKFLKVRAEQVENFLTMPSERTCLALPAAKLTDEAFASIGECLELEWLDLTANRVTGKQIQMLKNCIKLNKLFLTNCAIDAETLLAIEQFPKLRELDLSGSSVSDSILSSLRNQRLVNLRLTKSNVSDVGIRHLANFTELRSLEVSQTKVTEAGISWLKSRLPNLDISYDD